MEVAHKFVVGGRALLAGSEDYGAAYTTEFGKSYLGWEILVLLISAGLFAFYAHERYRGKGAEWEVLYIALVECVIYLAHIMYPKAPGAVILLAKGAPVNWLRYAGWLVTTPILIIHMQSLSGVAKLDDRLIQMLICNQAMILFGVTGAIATGASRGVAFTAGCVAMFILFYKAGEIYSKAFKTYPQAAKSWLVASMINFYVPWSCFPVLWLYGPEAGGQMGNGESVIAHCVADLSAKMTWGYITWHIHHVILHRVAHDYDLSMEEYSSARMFDVQFGHDADWTEDDPDSPSTFALDMVFTRRELEESLEELNHGRLRPSERRKYSKSQHRAGDHRDLRGGGRGGGFALLVSGGGGGGSGGIRSSTPSEVDFDLERGGGRSDVGGRSDAADQDDNEISENENENENDARVSMDIQRSRSRSFLVATALANGTESSRRVSPMASPRASNAGASFQALQQGHQAAKPSKATGFSGIGPGPGPGAGATLSECKNWNAATPTATSPKRTPQACTPEVSFTLENNNRTNNNKDKDKDRDRDEDSVAVVDVHDHVLKQPSTEDDAYFASVPSSSVKQDNLDLIRRMQSDLEQKSKEVQEMLAKVRRHRDVGE